MFRRAWTSAPGAVGAVADAGRCGGAAGRTGETRGPCQARGAIACLVSGL